MASASAALCYICWALRSGWEAECFFLVLKFLCLNVHGVISLISLAPWQHPEEGAQLTAALEFPSAPDTGALQAALKAVADRHDLLRTRFSSTSKGTLQVGLDFFTSTAPFPVSKAALLSKLWLLHMSCMAPTDIMCNFCQAAELAVRIYTHPLSHVQRFQATQVATFAFELAQVLGGAVPLQQKQLPAGMDLMAALEEEAGISLDPSMEGGVLRATLLEPAANGKQEAVLALTLHAVAGEEPSMQLLQSQIQAAYESAKSGAAAGLKPGLQFRDVLHWLSERQNKGVHPARYCGNSRPSC